MVKKKVDRDGLVLRGGDKIAFRTDKGNKINGEVSHEQHPNRRGEVTVVLGTDPFPVDVRSERIERTGKTLVSSQGNGATMTNTKTPSQETQRLRERARALKIPSWKTASRDDLRIAVRKAEKKAATTKTAPKKKSAPVRNSTRQRPPDGRARRSPATDTTNPYRRGSNMWHMAERLLKGGTRKEIVRELRGAIDIVPYNQDPGQLDLDFEIDKRLMQTVGDLLKRFKFTELREGRGLSGTIRVFPPGQGSKNGSKQPTGSPVQPRKASRGTSVAKNGSRARTAPQKAPAQARRKRR